MELTGVQETIFAKMLGLFTAAAGVIAVIGVAFFMAFFIFMLIAQCKMSMKMGEPGWVALIPFYNKFVLAKHAFGNGWNMFIILIPFAGIPWFFMKVFQGFGLEKVPALVLGLLAAPIGIILYGFNYAPWQGK